jgi:hypothetical protein
MGNLDSLTLEVKSAQKDLEIKKISRTGSWDRALVYDPESGNVDIRKTRDVQRDIANGIDIPLRQIPIMN